MKQKTFKANGVTYYEFDTLTFTRFEILEDLLRKLRYGEKYGQLINIVKDAFACLNKHQFGTAAVKLNNAIEVSDFQLSESRHPLLLIATLFFCRENEDRKTWNEANAESKIADWEAEGMEPHLFFSKVVNLYTNYMKLLGGISGDISTTKE